jgi:hypothetical protein
LNKIEIKRKTLDEYYKKLESYINQSNTKYNLDNLNCDLLYLFDKDFEYIVKLTPTEMEHLINKCQYKEFNKTILELKDLYETVRNKWAVWIIEQLDILVCPYCNREYVFKFEDTVKDKAKVIATFDHYYDKDRYPFLSVSLYNLIPSCYICNSKFKHNKNFYEIKHLHPYIDDFDSLVKFKLEINSVGFYYKEEEFQIKLDTNDKKAENTIKTFRLNEIYKQYKDIVLEIIKRNIIYNDDYIDELIKKYEGTLFNSKDELIDLIYCNYMDKKDINKRPLSKLTKDILEEIDKNL